MSPYCDDEKKYGVVDKVIAEYQQAYKNGDKLLNQSIRDVNTVNGIRITLEDGTWGLVPRQFKHPKPGRRG